MRYYGAVGLLLLSMCGLTVLAKGPIAQYTLASASAVASASKKSEPPKPISRAHDTGSQAMKFTILNAGAANEPDPDPNFTALKSSEKPVDDEPDLRGAEMIREIQRHLIRTGCLEGPIDGQWGRQSQEAMLGFLGANNSSLPIVTPNAMLFRAVSSPAFASCNDASRDAPHTARAATGLRAISEQSVDSTAPRLAEAVMQGDPRFSLGAVGQPQPRRWQTGEVRPEPVLRPSRDVSWAERAFNVND